MKKIINKKKYFIEIFNYLYDEYYANCRTKFNEEEIKKHLMSRKKQKRNIVQNEQIINFATKEVLSYLKLNKFISYKKNYFILNYNGIEKIQTIINSYKNNAENLINVIVAISSSCLAILLAIYNQELNLYVRMLLLLFFSIFVTIINKILDIMNTANKR